MYSEISNKATNSVLSTFKCPESFHFPPIYCYNSGVLAVDCITVIKIPKNNSEEERF